MSPPHVVIVGGGPMCAYAVERLAALVPTVALPRGLRISVFDRSGRFGAGATHSDRQPPASYMNRVASQIAFAADESNAGAGPLLPAALRPTFYEWARDRYLATGDERFRLEPWDVPRRYLHGMALREMFDRYVDLLRGVDGVMVELVAEEVVDIAPGDDPGARYAVRTATGRVEQADQVLLVTGHSVNRPRPGTLAASLAAHAEANPPARFVTSAYPLEVLDPATVPPGCAVAVLGLGLTAIDAVLQLTEGRGGRFAPVPSGGPWPALRYVASGGEPARIVAVSPSGLLTSCRPLNLKAADGSGAGHAALQHTGVFLTEDAIASLRRARGGPPRAADGRRPLDFARDVFPLVVLEMAYVYYRTLLGDGAAGRIAAAARPAYAAFLAGPRLDRDDAIAALLAPVQAEFDAISALADAPAAFRDVVDAGPDGRSLWGHSADLRDHRFDWRRLFDPLDDAAARSGAAWQNALVAYLRRDLAAAAQGNLRNPVKAACDGVWRDLRGVLSAACDFGGLTPDSHRETATTYLRYYSRMSNGTALEPAAKILALVDAGVLDLSIGPFPVAAPVPGRSRFRISGPLTSAAREVDVVVDGRAHPFDLDADERPLYRALAGRGVVRKWRNESTDGGAAYEPGGIDVTPDFHVVRADGVVDRGITALGAPVEGVAFFQLSAARPRSGSSVLSNAARWALDVVAALAAPDGEPVSEPALARPTPRG